MFDLQSWINDNPEGFAALEAFLLKRFQEGEQAQATQAQVTGFSEMVDLLGVKDLPGAKKVISELKDVVAMHTKATREAQFDKALDEALNVSQKVLRPIFRGAVLNAIGSSEPTKEAIQAIVAELISNDLGIKKAMDLLAGPELVLGQPEGAKDTSKYVTVEEVAA